MLERGDADLAVGSFPETVAALQAQGDTASLRQARLQHFTAGRVVAHSDLLTVLPAVFVNATGFREKGVTRPLPFELPPLHVDMLWHQRSDRSLARQGLREPMFEAAHTALA